MSVCCLSFLSSAAEPKWNFAFLYKWPTGAEAGCIFYQPTKKFFNKTKQIWNVAFCLFSIELWIPFLNFFPSILLNYVKTKTTNKRVFLFGRLQLFFFFWKKFGNQEKKVFSILISFCPRAFANQRFVKFCSGLHFQSKLLLLQLLELFPRVMLRTRLPIWISVCVHRSWNSLQLRVESSLMENRVAVTI